MLKKGVKGLPSDTRPYTISRGTPLSPSSACTRSIISPWNQCNANLHRLHEKITPSIKNRFFFVWFERDSQVAQSCWSSWGVELEWRLGGHPGRLARSQRCSNPQCSECPSPVPCTDPTINEAFCLTFCRREVVEKLLRILHTVAYMVRVYMDCVSKSSSPVNTIIPRVCVGVCRCLIVNSSFGCYKDDNWL